MIVAIQYRSPDTISEIDQKLENITGLEFARFTEQIAENFNRLAEQGNVPDELFAQDPKYWNVIVNIAHCKYQDTCDGDVLQEILDTRAYELDASDVPTVASNWLESVLPRAFAWSDALHHSVVYGEPKSCTYDTCMASVWETGVGEHQLLASPPSTTIHEGLGHGSSQEMTMHGSSCGSQNTHNTVHITTTLSSCDYEISMTSQNTHNTVHITTTIGSVVQAEAVSHGIGCAWTTVEDFIVSDRTWSGPLFLVPLFA